MADYIDSAVEDVLSSKRVLLRHPGSRSVLELYPSASQSSTQVAEVINSCGRYIISGNNLQLGSSTTFSISSSSIIDNWHLHASITVADNRALVSGWLLQACARIEITFSNSLMQSVQISGTALREYLLLTCPDSQCRQRLLEQAGVATNGDGGIYHASIPIGQLLISATGQRSVFGVDMSTLAGPIQILVQFNNAGSFTITSDAAGAAVPTAFTSLKLTVATHDLLSGAFSVRSAMQNNPSLSYNIPSKYINSVRIPIANFAANSNVIQTVSLNSAPAGMLEALLIILKPTSELNSTALATAALSVYNPTGGSVELDYLKLDYGGTSLFSAESSNEIEANYRSCFGGDTLTYEENCPVWDNGNPGAITTGGFLAANRKRIICIPLVYDGKSVFQTGKLVENVPSYSGAGLQLSFRVNPTFQRRRRLAASPFQETPELVAGAPGTAIPFTLEVVYVLAAVLEIAQGSIDLQL